MQEMKIIYICVHTFIITKILSFNGLKFYLRVPLESKYELL